MEEVARDLIAAIEWEASYIVAESEDEEIVKRGMILLECAHEARAKLKEVGTQDG